MRHNYVQLAVLLTLFPTASAQNSTCRLCSDGSDVPGDFLNASLFFMGGSQSCRTADEFLGRQTAAACETERQAAFADEIVDVEAFCGCPAATAPTLCGGALLCSQGGLVLSESEDLEVVLYGGNVTFTCLEIETLVPYIVDQNICDNGLKVAEATCCSDQPMVPTPITPAPSMAPSRIPLANGPSSGARSVEALAAALAIVSMSLVTLLI